MTGTWFWSVDRNKDDPAFMKTELSIRRSHREIVEDLLSQLTEQAEGHSQEEADLGAQTASTANGELE